MTTATKKKQSEATQELRYTTKYRQADEMFKNTVPDYMRDEALRDFFYRTSGKDLSSEEAADIANQVADTLKGAARMEALGVIERLEKDETVSDDEILRITGYTHDQIVATGKTRGMTTAEVYAELRKRIKQ